MKGNLISSFVKESLQTILTALILALLINFFIATPNQVDGISMEPNIHNDELILTNRVKHLVSSTFLGKQLSWDYERGEIIIFQKPGNKPFIKRVIGLPGDLVMVIDGRLVVNGKLIEEKYIPENVRTNSGTFLREGQETLIPENSYLAFGDNRVNSLDSRYVDVGFVKKEYIIGPAAFRIFPLNRIGFIPVGDFIEDGEYDSFVRNDEIMNGNGSGSVFEVEIPEEGVN